VFCLYVKIDSAWKNTKKPPEYQKIVDLGKEKSAKSVTRREKFVMSLQQLTEKRIFRGSNLWIKRQGHLAEVLHFSR
jgi:nitrate/nitrite-specific signal transduction histidine kinase